MSFQEKQSFTDLGRRNVESLGRVQICPTLYTFARKCTLRTRIAFMVPDEGTSVHVETACFGKIVLGNLFLVPVRLDLKDFIASNIEKLSATDYGDLNSAKIEKRIGKLGVDMLTKNTHLMPRKYRREQLIAATTW